MEPFPVRKVFHNATKNFKKFLHFALFSSTACGSTYPYYSIKKESYASSQ